ATCSRRWPNCSPCAVRTISTTTTRSGPGASLTLARCPMRWLESCWIGVAIALLAFSNEAQAQSPYGIGRPATAAEIAGWNIDVGRDGRNLPEGGGWDSQRVERLAQQPH